MLYRGGIMQERYIRDMYIGGAFNTTFSLGERNIRMNDKDIREKLQETLQVECEQLEKDLHWQEERLETLTSVSYTHLDVYKRQSSLR